MTHPPGSPQDPGSGDGTTGPGRAGLMTSPHVPDYPNPAPVPPSPGGPAPRR